MSEANIIMSIRMRITGNTFLRRDGGMESFPCYRMKLEMR